MKTLPILMALALALPLTVKAQTLNDARRPLIQIQADLVHNMTYRGMLIRGQGQIVAVLDSGIHHLHPHLMSKIAHNTTDMKIDGLDNDRNGFVDDYNGWNFFKNNGNAMDDHGHGTHVSGTIVADQYGVAPAANVVPVKITINPQGAISEQHMVDAIRYAVDNGAKIINLSIRGIYDDMPVTAYVIEEAVKYASQKDVLVVVAAGNDGENITNKVVLPAVIESDNLITVCAVDSLSMLASFSNFSKTKVHLCAPGVDVVSANKNHYAFAKYANPFAVMSGTSMAAPIVTGVAALLWSMEPGLKARDIKNIIMASARKRSHMTPMLQNSSQTGAVINAYDAVGELMRRTKIYR